MESGRICYALWISCVLARFRGSDKLYLGHLLRSSIFSYHTLRNNFLHTYKHTLSVKSNPCLLLPQQPPVKMLSSCPHLFLQKNKWITGEGKREKKEKKETNNWNTARGARLAAYQHLVTSKQHMRLEKDTSCWRIHMIIKQLLKQQQTSEIVV